MPGLTCDGTSVSFVTVSDPPILVIGVCRGSRPRTRLPLIGPPRGDLSPATPRHTAYDRKSTRDGWMTRAPVASAAL
jgi:hypothetical protein